ncbi:MULTISPECIES: citrate synthase [Aneurinibacillus]|uniref:Citrate synthase n=1 Tax=Aneurinibacillus thermoaerophilus TaxID=143495 RepID=A0A1G7WTF1_ANETH|nr:MULTISPECIES: citrate synthase [Aneurinibacillus]AMA73966.1 citrate synthase [Aneurinibacillus sp. XH2]MED0676221.1 citrate synthase [Aneurinibacillus thermoaerophilus]MED0678153.1 citrate synthase [Aneurinibacillus thermoaerophilus]MED0737661.1 citrate synthase [Aneurinibacillus thermoaerophilus]MED0755653.1 citrate synthase [Aneurinibacillus thermoaerophilus]
MSAKGLEGIVAAQSSISSIIDGVLTYAGINIDELAENASFEEVVYLLWHGRLPKANELSQLKKDLAENAAIPEDVITLLKTIPEGNHPMAVLRTAISALALYDPEAQDMSREANLRKATRLQAKVATVVAAYHRIRQGKEVVAPHAEFGYAQNFLYMLNGEEPDQIAIDALDTALVLHADHELNASTFAARVTVATLSDIYSGITSAIGALKGPLHGGANEAVMAMLEEIKDPGNAESYIRNKLANKEKIMGFGHRVYKDGDPRAKHLRKMSEKLTKLTGQPQWYEMSVKIDELVTAEKGLKPNVDFYSASVYHSLGIPRDLFTPIFAISRMSGWTAHILEQYENNRLIRPRAEYVGPVNAHYVPLEER